MTEVPKRHRLDVLGDSYVADDCCLLCGIPKHVAPMLFDEDRESCFVQRQPSSRDEVDMMIKTMTHQDLTCVRYAGKDETILRRLANADESDKCDALR